jgi:hypothetical protein
MVGGDEARGRSACLTGESPSARGARDVARAPRAAVDARAHDILVEGKPKRSKLRARTVENALRLLFERLARLAFEPNVCEPLTLFWNRLDKRRWDSAKIALRQKSRRKNSIEVDHIVACDLWNSKLPANQETPPAIDGEQQVSQIDDIKPRVNDLGNCMLLEKTFNMSKSNSTLKSFLEGVHEFKDQRLELADWAAALDLDMVQVDSATTPVETLLRLFNARSQKIRSDLEKFIGGTINRIDLDA